MCSDRLRLPQLQMPAMLVAALWLSMLQASAYVLHGGTARPSLGRTSRSIITSTNAVPEASLAVHNRQRRQLATAVGGAVSTLLIPSIAAAATGSAEPHLGERVAMALRYEASKPRSIGISARVAGGRDCLTQSSWPQLRVCPSLNSAEPFPSASGWACVGSAEARRRFLVLGAGPPS